jgi:Kef-type K+ transport system membrane component KefB
MSWNRRIGARVGIGMISRGEVGLIVAGIGLTAGIIGQDVYAQIVAMAVITTVITPIMLRRSFGNKKNETTGNNKNQSVDVDLNRPEGGV